MNKEIMLKKLNEKLENMSKEEFLQYLKDNGIEVEEEKEEIKYSNDNNCPHCKWHNEDEYRHIKSRMIGDRRYDTQQCTQCGKEFDKVYKMIYLRSQTTLSTNELLKEE